MSKLSDPYGWWISKNDGEKYRAGYDAINWDDEAVAPIADGAKPQTEKSNTSPKDDTD